MSKGVAVVAGVGEGLGSAVARRFAAGGYKAVMWARSEDKVNGFAERIRAKLPKGRTFHLVRIRSIPRNAMGKIPRAMIADKLTALYGASRKNISNA